MTADQQKFLYLAVIKGIPYSELEQKFGIPRKVFSPWWDELKEERLELTKIRNIWKNKCPDLAYKEFSNWYLRTERKCHYCDLTESQIKTLWEKDPELALIDGLFKDEFLTPSFEANGFLAYDDFWEFGIRIGILKSRVIKILDQYRSPMEEVAKLTERSFLDQVSKKLYSDSYQSRLKALNYSLSKLI